LLAELSGWSGVLATITAGLVMGNFKSFGAISDRGKEAVQAIIVELGIKISASSALSPPETG
jgi:hypothetical protein